MLQNQQPGFWIKPNILTFEFVRTKIKYLLLFDIIWILIALHFHRSPLIMSKKGGENVGRQSGSEATTERSRGENVLLPHFVVRKSEQCKRSASQTSHEFDGAHLRRRYPPPPPPSSAVPLNLTFTFKYLLAPSFSCPRSMLTIIII